ncbi:MAG: LptE family protein [Phycisphaerales bacterium]
MTRLRMPTRRAISRLAMLSTALLSLVALASCASDPKEGYSATNPYATKYKTVAVDIFKNRSYIRSFEFDLAEALTKRISVSTPYHITSEAAADTVLRGTITSITLSELSRDPTTGLSNEVMVKVVVDFDWTDLKTGKPIAARNGFATSALFVPSRPAQEPLELARFEAVQQLARDLVDQMQSSW